MARKKQQNKRNEVLGVCCFIAGLFILLSLLSHTPEDHPFYTSTPNNPIQNATGIIGSTVSHYALFLFGNSAFFISALFILWAISLFLQKVPDRKRIKFLGFLLCLSSASGIFAWATSSSNGPVQGGVIGFALARFLETYFGSWGAGIILAAFLVLSILLTTDFFLLSALRTTFNALIHVCQIAGEGLLTGLRLVGSVLLWLYDLKRFLIFGKARNVQDEEEEEEEEDAPVKKTAAQKKADKIKKAKEKERKQKLEAKRLREEEKMLKKEAREQEKLARLEAKQRAVEEAEAVAKEQAAELEKQATPVKVKRYTSTSKQEQSPKQKTDVETNAVVDSGDGKAVYMLPPISILSPAEKPTETKDDSQFQEDSRTLVSTLNDFGIQAQVVEIEQGPVLTRYEISPAPGTKVSSIVNLADDIALSLKVARVRIVGPIPGKGTIGIEVPNTESQKVCLRELLEYGAAKIEKCRLPLVIGKDVTGKPLISDLAEMPHMLIAGTTGSGKTVCVNAIIAGLIYKMRPDELKFVMIDPKMVELAVYNALPHMLAPVVTDVRKAAGVLNWVINEMENRYKLLAKVGARNIQTFNSAKDKQALMQEDIEESSDEELEESLNLSLEESLERDAKKKKTDIPERLPYIVVIIDELADLMMTSRDKVETSIARLAQLARAVGIHLILATQRPSVDVITGVIKANFPARLSFKVASKTDSRTVLDSNGADILLGKGDLLFLEPGKEKTLRGQGAYVTDDEINGLVEFVKKQQKPEYHDELDRIQNQPAGSARVHDKDELYDEAVQVILDYGQASTSVLQRKLRLGYGRAARILDMMEQGGIVGPPQGTKSREILVTNITEEPS